MASRATQWLTSDDERVRPSHREKVGKFFRWDDPPADTGHPGADIQCRCVAIAALLKRDRDRLKAQTDDPPKAPPPPPPPAVAPEVKALNLHGHASERAFKRGFNRAGIEAEEIEEVLGMPLEEFAEQTFFEERVAQYIGMREGTLEAVLSSGEIKNGLQTGRTFSGHTLAERFNKVEKPVFNLADDVLNEPRRAPKYGFIASRDAVGSEATGYGPVAIRLKPAVRRRSTITVGDSMAANSPPGPYPRRCRSTPPARRSSTASSKTLAGSASTWRTTSGPGRSRRAITS